MGSTKDSKSWIGDAISIIKEVNNLINTVNNNPFVKRFLPQESGQTLGSGNTGKTIKSGRKAPPPAESSGAGGFSNEDMTKFFSTPEGLNKIADAIDQLQPIIGDAKLSEVKELIKMVGGKKENEVSKTGDKTEAGATAEKPKSSKNSTGKKHKGDK